MQNSDALRRENAGVCVKTSFRDGALAAPSRNDLQLNWLFDN
jgi:hypothetical protein